MIYFYLQIFHWHNSNTMLQIIKMVNLVIAFLLEIAMIISFGYFGFHFPVNIAMKYFLMIGLPLIVAVLCGYFAAPKSKKRLPKIPRTLFALVLYASSIFLLSLTGKTILAAVFAILVVINQLLLFIPEE